MFNWQLRSIIINKLLFTIIANIGLFVLLNLSFSSIFANTNFYPDLNRYLENTNKLCKVTIAPLPSFHFFHWTPPPRFDLIPSLFLRELQPSKRLSNPSILSQASSPVTQSLLLHYANALNVAKFFNKKEAGLLSPNGQIIANEENNSLWIREQKDRISAIKHILQDLDKPASQVFIKAKIVNIDSDYVHQLGIVFQSKQNNSQTLTAEGGGIEDLTIPIAKLGHDILLEATLDALEKQGHARLISNPQLMTINHRPAILEAGEEVPYQQTTISGATAVTFKKAVLRLKVTPDIMPDKRILLHLNINQDQVSSLTVNGVPAINTQAITTQVYVRNQTTLVLGGILETSDTNGSQGIPGINKVPVLGGLFRHQARSNDRKQLLIFVTPIIMPG